MKKKQTSRMRLAIKSKLVFTSQMPCTITTGLYVETVAKKHDIIVAVRIRVNEASIIEVPY